MWPGKLNAGFRKSDRAGFGGNNVWVAAALLPFVRQVNRRFESFLFLLRPGRAVFEELVGLNERIGAFATPRVEAIFGLRIYLRGVNAVARSNSTPVFLYFPPVDHRFAIADDEFGMFAGSCVDTEYAGPVDKDFGIRSDDP